MPVALVAGRRGARLLGLDFGGPLHADGPVGPGFITVFPCGQPIPTASNLNFVAGDTVHHAVVEKVGAGGATLSMVKTEVAGLVVGVPLGVLLAFALACLSRRLP